MKKKDKKVIDNIKESAKVQVEKVKDFAKDVEEKVGEHKDFKRHSVKIKRLNSKVFNLEAQLYGVFDQEKLTLTYRIKDEFSVNEILEIGSNMYQVQSIQPVVIMFPLLVDGEEHEVECRVLDLKLVDKVE
ncbi:MAG: hypothetical protein Q7I99_04590 [Acholeplasmataceae bacterium]|nr:hypothetical protein [Acholeplasmataceae bacterium]